MHGGIYRCTGIYFFKSAIQDFNGNSMEKCYRKIAERPLEYLKKRCYIIDKRSATDRRLGPRKYGLKNNR